MVMTRPLGYDYFIRLLSDWYRFLLKASGVFGAFLR
jgi:hypothetical protein